MKRNQVALISALTGVVAGLGISSAAWGATVSRYWISDNGGTFADSANWAATANGAGGQTVPDADDNAFFKIAIGGAKDGIYDVTFGAAAGGNLFTVTDSNDVTFKLGGFTYALSGTAANSYVDIGSTTGGHSKLTLENGTVQTGSNNPVRIGAGVAGTEGSLTITSGSVLEAAGLVYVGQSNSGATGHLTVDGQLKMVGTVGGNVFTVGGGAIGDATIRNGGLLTSGSTFSVGQGTGEGTFTVTGTGSTATFSAASTHTIGYNNAAAKGTVKVLSGGKVEVAGPVSLSAGSTVGGTGAILVDGANSKFISSYVGSTSSPALTLGTSPTSGATPSSIEVKGGGLLQSAGYIKIGPNTTATGYAGGTVLVTGNDGAGTGSRLSAALGMALGASGGSGVGTLTVGTDGTVQLGGSSVINKTGTLNLTGGSVELMADNVSLGNVGVITGEGFIHGASGVSGARLYGSTNGVLAPGHSAGKLTLDNIVFDQKVASAKIELELGAATAGGYDQIFITNGTATITTGFIDFTNLLSGFAGGTYDLIVADTVSIDAAVVSAAQADLVSLLTANSVTYTSLSLGVVPDGLNGQDTFRLSVAVPEPASLGIVGLLTALGALGRRRR